MSHLDAGSFGDALHDSSVQGTLCGEEGSTVQGRIAREPIDRSRYVVINGRSGTTFVCSRCNKQYIHRKSLNKHWNDKHADDSIDRGKYLTSRNCSVSELVKNPFIVELVQCPNTVHMALSCTSSLVTPAGCSSAGCSPANSVVSVASSQQKTYSDLHRSQIKHSGSIRDSMLWHSLAAIHLNQEHNLNSFCSAPMPAHIGGHYNVRESFFNKLFYDDNCQVLDLSKGSSDLDELSNVSVADAPIDLSLKSNSMCLAGSEKGDSPLHYGIVETVSKSAASYCTEVSAVDTLILNEPKKADKWIARFGDSRKDCIPAQLDSVSLLRHLHSGVLANATNKPVQADSGCCNTVAFVSDELKSYHSEVEPLASCECCHNSMHFKSNLNLISKLPDFATSKETHDFFGGISRGGYIRCKMCDFSATSMLLFSRHVANHVRKPNISGDSVQEQCGKSRDKECGFFMWLGLHRTSDAAVDTDQRTNDGCHYAEGDCLDTDEYLKSRCKAVVTDVQQLSILEVQGKGFTSALEVGQLKKNSSIDPVQQKPGCYKRGLGLTTTESRDAAGRSWRRRRLRTCERCGYVTDNLTTLKRHEVKHGALGMYRCKLCDYTVNQQHILEYHTRNVHRLSRQIGTANSTLFKHTNIPFVNNVVDKQRCAINATTLVGGNQQVSWNNDFPEMVTIGDNTVEGGCAALTSSSEVATVESIQCTVNKCSSQKAMSKIVQYPTSVTLARRCLLDAFGLRLGGAKCVRCGFRSLSNVRMKQHMLRHPHERYVCTMCPHTSLTAQLLLKHKRQHPDCRPGYLAQKKTYHCPECPFLATSPNRLQCHTQFHGVKLRHVCGKCSYSVDRANLIAQHRRLHASALKTVEKRCWLHCSKCPFKTINRVLLVNHERGHYSINCQYMCSLCSFGTDIANVALSHQRLH